MADDTRPKVLRANAAGIAAAARALLRGEIVALPTETVYGLAARADRDDAVAAIYKAKGRPSFNPLIVHVADLDQARALAQVDERMERLAKAFWPGPLTIVVPRRSDSGLAEAVTAGLPTVALRSPAHPVMRSVLAATRLPLAAPSANRSGGVSPTTAAHVASSLGQKVAMILDGGACAAGIESTIVALRDSGSWEVLRPGPISADQLCDVLGNQAHESAAATGIEAPGQLASHYAPGKPVRLNASQADTHEFHIGFAGVKGEETLSATGDLEEAAARLYELLHRAAGSSKTGIAVAPIPEEGVGIAINDRLRRAAADQ